LEDNSSAPTIKAYKANKSALERERTKWKELIKQRTRGKEQKQWARQWAEGELLSGSGNRKYLISGYGGGWGEENLMANQKKIVGPVVHKTRK
jgi:hypothetical protein